MLAIGYGPVIKHESQMIWLRWAKLLMGLDKGLDFKG